MHSASALPPFSLSVLSRSRRLRAGLLAAALTAVALGEGGCSIWPSSWRLGGSPIDREHAAAVKAQSAREAEVAAAQRAVHQTGTALDSLAAELGSRNAERGALNSELGTRNAELGTLGALAASRDFNAEASALLDQARGAPTASDAAAWRQLALDTIAGRDQAREAQRAEVATLSTKLAQAEAAHARTLEAVKRDAETNTYWADLAHKFILIAIVIVLLIVASHLVGLAAHLNPGSALLGGAATALHSVLASGAVLAERSAADGLRRVGAGLALVRQKLPAIATEVTSFLDATTAAHPTAQAHIATGALAAGSPTTTPMPHATQTTP